MSLPAPNSTFTIPSLHDDLELDCRLYYPRYSEKNHFFGNGFAILAHPYAPLGGCQDDHVVAYVGSALLQSGITLGTFNFRGAGSSAGRTSWTGKAELADYVAFYGFMVSLIRYAKFGNREAEIPKHRPRVLILGGYSYGSLIASCLPAYELVAGLFQTVKDGSAAREIKGRAQQIARDLVAYFDLHQQGAIPRGRSSLRIADAQTSPGRSVAAGGYDSEAAGRRISRESSRRSIDTGKVRRSLDRARQKILSRSMSDQAVKGRIVEQEQQHDPTDLAIAYLLVSPLLSHVTAFTTMFSKPTFERRDPEGINTVVKDGSDKDEKFTRHPTCIIYGNKDVFTSAKRLGRWVTDLQKQAGPSLSTYGVDGAGHFWTEREVAGRLQSNVRDWLSSLQSQSFAANKRDER